MLGEVAGQAIEGGLLLFEEAFYVGGDFVFVAEDEFVGVVEDFLRFGLCQGDFAANGDQHGGGAAALRVEEKRDGLKVQDFAVQNGVGAARLGGNFVGGSGEKFVDGGGSESLFDAIAVGGVFERGNGDDVDAFGERIAAAGYVVATGCDISATS